MTMKWILTLIFPALGCWRYISLSDKMLICDEPQKLQCEMQKVEWAVKGFYDDTAVITVWLFRVITDFYFGLLFVWLLNFDCSYPHDQQSFRHSRRTGWRVAYTVFIWFYERSGGKKASIILSFPPLSTTSQHFYLLVCLQLSSVMSSAVWLWKNPAGFGRAESTISSIMK